MASVTAEQNWKKRLAFPLPEVQSGSVFRVFRLRDLRVGGTGLMPKDDRVARGQPLDRNLLGKYRQQRPK